MKTGFRRLKHQCWNFHIEEKNARAFVQCYLPAEPFTILFQVQNVSYYFLDPLISGFTSDLIFLCDLMFFTVSHDGYCLNNVFRVSVLSFTLLSNLLYLDGRGIHIFCLYQQIKILLFFRAKKTFNTYNLHKCILGKIN